MNWFQFLVSFVLLLIEGLQLFGQLFDLSFYILLFLRLSNEILDRFDEALGILKVNLCVFTLVLLSDDGAVHVRLNDVESS